jgi:ATP-binding cassette subfamily B protein
MSGSGKSTLIKLIAGYIMPDTGKVLVDGQDLSTVSLQSYYAHVGYLTQDPSVFDGTIRENLAYGMDHEPEE